MQAITTRQREILTAIVESYIATGEPVSSGAVVQSPALSSAMSPATVRNEMASLAEAGLLEQPHTSAGRVPSAAAFRLYVAQLTGGAGAAGGAGLRRGVAFPRADVQMQIEQGLANAPSARSLLARTSHVLATLSSGVGVAVSPMAVSELLEHVHFTRLGERRVLTVVVTRGGTVRDRLLELGRDLSSAELESAARFLNEHFRGWALEGVRAELARRLEQERSEYQRMMASAQALWAGAVAGSAAAEQTVFVEGVANLVAVPEDRGRLRDLLAALEARERLIELLNAYVDARQESVRVIFDLEEHAPEMAGLVLIAAPARLGGEAHGTVGVLGPKRIHYENAIGAVRYVAEVFERMSQSVGGGVLGPPPL